MSGKPSEEEAHAILKEAYNQGIKTLDTASAYGSSEEVIGNYHRKSAVKFSVITKFHIQEGKEISEIVENALHKLGVGSIETLFFHSYQDYLSNPNALQVLTKEVVNGRINHIGVSVYTNNEIEALLPVQEIDVIQAPFNLLDNHNKRAEVFQRARSSGKKVHTRSVFLQGLFFRPINSLPKSLLALKSALVHINQIAKEAGVSVASLALNYALNKEYIDRVLVGVDSASQLNNNMNSLKDGLSDEIVQVIDEIKVSEPSLLNPSKWTM